MKISIDEGSRIAEAAAKKFKQKFSWVPFEDLKQEAWIGMLTAKNFDAKKGRRDQYFFRAACHRLRRYTIKNRLPLSGMHYEALEKLKTLSTISLEDAKLLADTPDPLALTELRERIRKIRAVLSEILHDDIDEAIALLTGETRARDIEGDTAKIYRRTRRNKTRLAKSPALRALYAAYLVV